MTSKHTQNSLPFDIGVRVSRVGAREGDSFISPSLQLRRARDHADARGLKVGVVFEELDVSGGDPDRPDLELAVRRVEEGKSGGIIVLRFDRFARDMAVWAGCLKRIQDAGGTVLSVLEGADLRTPDGRTMANMLMSIAQGQRENAVLNFADGRREAVKRGVHICPVPPAGYARESGMPLHPDPAAAPVISELFDRAAAGESWSTLARWLEAQGVRTAYGNAGWSPIGVKRLVRNRAYLGIAYHGEFERADSHPALTDRETWERAQRRQRQTRPRSQCRPWLLAGLVRCAGCRYVPAPFFARGKRRFKCRRCYPGGVCPAPVDALSGGLEDHVVDAFFAELGDIELQAAEADSARDQARRDLAAREAALNEFLLRRAADQRRVRYPPCRSQGREGRCARPPRPPTRKDHPERRQPAREMGRPLYRAQAPHARERHPSGVRASRRTPRASRGRDSQAREDHLAPRARADAAQDGCHCGQRDRPVRLVGTLAEPQRRCSTARDELSPVSSSTAPSRPGSGQGRTPAISSAIGLRSHRSGASTSSDCRYGLPRHPATDAMSERPTGLSYVRCPVLRRVSTRGPSRDRFPMSPHSAEGPR